VLVANEQTVEALKVRLVQGSRTVLNIAVKLHGMSLVAAKEGPYCGQKIFNPAPTYGELEEEEAKQLEKYRKDREASKKKEASELSKSSWMGGGQEGCLQQDGIRWFRQWRLRELGPPADADSTAGE
jgi:hypothetical protein